MKEIDTLVEDIYKVVDEGSDEEDLEPAVDYFLSNIKNTFMTRLSKGSDHKPRLRLSAIGDCARKQWYALHGYEPEKLKPYVRLKFLFGDMLEELLLMLAKLSGHEVRGEQDELEIEGIKGHRDAVIDGFTVDVKSASARSFAKFEDGSIMSSDAFGYIPQISSYVKAGEDVRKEAGYFLAFHKEMGRITSMEVKSEDFPDVHERAKFLIEAVAKDTVPDRPYEPVADGKSGNMKLPVKCSYCHMKNECWKDSNEGAGLRTFLYSNGPRHLTTVVKEPNVQELI